MMIEAASVQETVIQEELLEGPRSATIVVRVVEGMRSVKMYALNCMVKAYISNVNYKFRDLTKCCTNEKCQSHLPIQLWLFLFPFF